MPMSEDKRNGASSFFPILIILAAAAIAFVTPATGADWDELVEGIAIAWFSSDDSLAINDSLITIIRVDPAKYDIVFASISESGDSSGLSVKEWCRRENLLLAVNGGMFDRDFSTHIGYMKNGEHVNNSRRNKYKSALANGATSEEFPDFYLYDLDETPLDSIIARYDRVMQNLRLIKHSRENMWEPGERRWTEAALGQDSSGNALFILCRRPMTMYEFNERLLSLSIGIIAAQHLEGGVETQMYIRIGDFELGLSGGFDSRLAEGNGGDFFFKLPNIIGIKARPTE